MSEHLNGNQEINPQEKNEWASLASTKAPEFAVPEIPPVEMPPIHTPDEGREEDPTPTPTPAEVKYPDAAIKNAGPDVDVMDIDVPIADVDKETGSSHDAGNELTTTPNGEAPNSDRAASEQETESNNEYVNYWDRQPTEEDSNYTFDNIVTDEKNSNERIDRAVAKGLSVEDQDAILEKEIAAEEAREETLTALTNDSTNGEIWDKRSKAIEANQNAFGTYHSTLYGKKDNGEAA